MVDGRMSMRNVKSDNLATLYHFHRLFIAE